MSGVVTRCCSFRFDPGGFVHATMNQGATFEESDARDAVAASWQVAGERRAPVLVDMRGMRAESRAAREYFTSEETASKVSAVALLVGSPVSKMIGNLFLRLGAHRIPTRLFTDDASARRWIGEQTP